MSTELLDVPQIDEGFNDDDWYVMDKKTGKMVKHLGRITVPWGTRPEDNKLIKPELKSPDWVAMRGMTAKYFKRSPVNENADHETLLKIAQRGHLRALKTGNASLARHYAKRMAYHTRYLVK